MVRLLALWLMVAFAGGALGASDEPQVWAFEVRDGWGDRTLVLLTGFGPFGGVPENPSGRIIHRFRDVMEQGCPREGRISESQVLPVRFGIIERVAPERYDAILSVGVAPGSRSLRVETTATNYYWDSDRGEGGPIDPELPATAKVRGGPLPPNITRPTHGFEVVLGDESSAGTYVCNETFFRACRKVRRSYFIHIPNVAPREDDRLAGALGVLACRILVPGGM